MRNALRRIRRFVLPIVWPALLAVADERTQTPAVGVIGSEADPLSSSERIGPSIRLVPMVAERICEGQVGEPVSEDRRGREAILLPWPASDPACWFAGLARVASAAQGSGRVYVVGDPDGAVSDPATFAFLLKRAAVTLRAADRSARVLAGPLPSDERWLASIGEMGLGPYLDGLAADSEGLAAVLRARDVAFPTAVVWSVERGPPAPGEPPGLIRAANALAAGADVALVLASTASDLDALAALVRATPPGARAASSPTVLAVTGRSAPVLELVGDAGDRLVVLPASDEIRMLRIGPPPVGEVEVIDPDAGRSAVPVRRPPGALPEVRIDAVGAPLLLAVRPAADLRTEGLEVGDKRPGLTAEEIVAREREARARQALRLDHFQAHARVDYHFALANFGETLDVVSENDAFGRGDAVEYRQRALYINGSLWKGEPPEFPFISREKVLEVPLALNLREGYRYVLEKDEEMMGGWPCYRIAFEPGPEAAGDFRGRVWIDRESFLRTRLDLVRLAPAQPVTSDVLTQWYSEVESEAGAFRLITRMEGQMVFSALGQNAIVDRRVELREFRLNAPTFDEELQAALESRDRMYRDSLEEGLVALVPDPESGGRAASGVGPDSNTLLLMGWHGSLDGGLGGPIAGINWFDMNVRDRGMQIDVAWAVVAGALSITWPRSESEWEASLQVLGTAIPRRDRYVDDTGKVPDEQLDRLDERVQGTFRRKLGPYFTLAVEPSLSYLSVSRRNGTRDDYVLPPETVVSELALRLGYHRSGVRLGLWSSIQHRLDWGPYGVPEDLAAARDTPIAWGLSANKSFYPGKLDRLSLDLGLYGGARLDRFSAFQRLGLEDTSVLGFSSAGLRFTQGALTEIGYAWRMGGNVRWEAGVGGGVFRSPEDYGEDWQNAWGVDLAASFPGPWGTMFRVRTAYGIDSSIPVSGSDGSTRLTVVKTFPGWWPFHRKGKSKDNGDQAGY